MIVYNDERSVKIRQVKELLRSETAAMAVISQLLPMSKREDLSELLSECSLVHLKHKKIVQRILESLTVGPANCESAVPASMDSFIRSSLSNPRTPYGLLQALETHMQECTQGLLIYEFPEFVTVTKEQSELTEQVNITVQSLTRVLPHSVIRR